MKYFRVKFGYGKDEFYSIPEEDLNRAMRAQINGTVFVCEDGTIAGNNIMSISPDYNRALGVNRDYVLTGEDYNELGSLTVREHRALMQDTKLALADFHTKKKPKLLESHL